MRNRDAFVMLNDPSVNYWPEMQETVPSTFPNERVDGVILAVAHKIYRDIEFIQWLKENTSVVFDAAILLTDTQRADLRNHGIKVESIGRGEGL